MPRAISSTATVGGGGEDALTASEGAARSPVSPSIVCFATRYSAVVKSSTFTVSRVGDCSPPASW